MAQQPEYHMIYVPGNGRRRDKIIGLLYKPSNQRLLSKLRSVPGSIALELEAMDMDELKAELKDLGFYS
jgi:hypothetical protein